MERYMNRLRVLKKRANREGCGIIKENEYWLVYAGRGKSWAGFIDGRYTRREAIQKAAQMALPEWQLILSVNLA
jgi:hypothetical protein